MASAAKKRVYFLSGDIVVSGVAVTTGERAFAIDEITHARTQRIRPGWLGPLGALIEHYLLVLTTKSGDEVVALRRRNGYFIWKLAHAVECAVRDAAGSAVLPGWRWVNRAPLGSVSPPVGRSAKAGMISQQLAGSPNSSA